MATKRESASKDQGQPFELLFEQARKVGEDEQLYWDNVEILQKRTNRETMGEIFRRCDGDSSSRKFAVDVLGRFHESAPIFVAEVVARLLKMQEVEGDVNVLESLAAALSHQQEEPRVFAAMVQLSKHSSWRVRWHLALGLAKYRAPEAIELLIALMEDPDERVRDWATFALGNRQDLDTSALRAAFVARLKDSDAHTRAEALYALAERKDPRVASAVLEEFKPERDKPLIFDAIEDSPGYRLLPALREMAQDAEYAGDLEELKAAIAVCEAHS